MRGNPLNHPEYREIFRELCVLSETYGTQATDVFVPPVPHTWGQKERLKVIWYGSATNGWDTDNGSDVRAPKCVDFDMSQKSSAEFLKETPNKSRFWRVMEGCAAKWEIDRADVMWNNVHKLGGEKGEPSNALKRAQLDFSKSAFDIEIQALKPNLIVFHIGELANETVPHLLDENGWSHWNRDSEIAWFHPNITTPTIWVSRSRLGTDESYIHAAHNASSKARAQI